MENLQELIDGASRIVFFGGAGVSTESGIPDFRSVDGLYHQSYDYPPEEILSHGFFMSKTEEFYKFYRAKLVPHGEKPNKAHLKLAEMEQKSKLLAVITQNIDGLHQAAGSKNVLELHGSVHRNTCMSCGKHFGVDAVKNSVGVPRCDCGGIIKPDVVLYDEGLNGDTIQKSIEALRSADLLIIGGTSLTVYPAAGLISYFGNSKIVVINRDATPRDESAALVIREKIGETLSKIIVR